MAFNHTQGYHYMVKAVMNDCSHELCKRYHGEQKHNLYKCIIVCHERAITLHYITRCNAKTV